MEPADVKRLRSLERENAKLKKLVAERDLELMDIARSGLDYVWVRAHRDRPTLEAMKRLAGLTCPVGGLAHARQVIEEWRKDYNEDRPKRDLGGVPPVVHAARLNSLANSGAKESSTVCGDGL